jgi:XTP/dITP diphosphohydrolase
MTTGGEPLTLVMASANPDKAAEIAAVMAASLPVEIVPRPAGVPEVIEDGATLLDNARLKANALCAATGLPAVADDTGLEVEALNGEPGVYSARYAGEDATYADNVHKLLAALNDLPDAGGNRRARFITIAIAVFPDGTELWAEGSVQGSISATERGEAGFGYDPIFAPDEGGGRTFAEMTSDEKHAISHRGRAVRALSQLLVAHQAKG